MLYGTDSQLALNHGTLAKTQVKTGTPSNFL